MKPFKKVIFISQLCSPHIFENILSTSLITIGQAGPKFYRLLAEGLSMHNITCFIQTLSVPPVSTSSHKKCFWKIQNEVVDKIKYNYVPILNLPVLRNILVFIYSFLKIISWNTLKKDRNNVIICDVLGLSVTLASILASKLTRTKIIAIVTDLPNFMVVKSRKIRIYRKIVSLILSKFDGYIFLTEKMNESVNTHKKPYIIMEGIVDVEMGSSANILENKASKRILLYAGGIQERYGIKRLIHAFMRLQDSDLQLSIYGSGEMEKEMSKYMNLDSRIIYHGVVANKLVVQKETEATLLINPRSSDEEFTKFSFPSKNMEYMASGTPLLTTPLPGMPDEYKKFVYLFDNESEDGFYLTLKSLLNKSTKELHQFGLIAKQFVLDNKSNLKQAKRILDFIETF